MSELILYGISNCDTVKKALKALEAEEIIFHFHDFRKDGLTETVVSGMLEALGKETVLNTRGTTWRKLSQQEQARAETDLAGLLVSHPALIKRPVWEKGALFKIGFKASDQRDILAWAKARQPEE